MDLTRSGCYAKAIGPDNQLWMHWDGKPYCKATAVPLDAPIPPGMGATKLTYAGGVVCISLEDQASLPFHSMRGIAKTLSGTWLRLLPMLVFVPWGKKRQVLALSKDVAALQNKIKAAIQAKQDYDSQRLMQEGLSIVRRIRRLNRI